MNLKYWQFPIIPIVEKQKRTEHRHPSFSFLWLFIKFYTARNFGFFITIHLNISDGIGIGFHLFYCYLTLAFPLPHFVERFIHTKLYLK